MYDPSKRSKIVKRKKSAPARLLILKMILTTFFIAVRLKSLMSMNISIG